MVCNKCIHNDICEKLRPFEWYTNGNCPYFNNEANFIKIPCKVGTEIFGAFDNVDTQREEIYKGKIVGYSINIEENNLLWMRPRYENGFTLWYPVEDFGKTIFFTEEEVEEALKKTD